MRGSLSGVRSRVDRLALKLAPVQVGCPSCRNQEDTTRVCCIYGNEKPKMPETRCHVCGRLIPVRWVSVAYDINMKPADL
jgi:hypothetical protein